MLINKLNFIIWVYIFFPTFLSSLPHQNKRSSDEECIAHNVALIGGDLRKSSGGGGIKTESATECLEKCSEQTSCFYFTYVEKWNINCYLKNNEGGNEQDMDGAVTGWIADNCLYQTIDNFDIQSQDKSDLIEQTGCAYDDIAFLGKDLPKSKGGDGIRSTSFEECGVKCGETEGCMAWNYVQQWDINCYLKSEIGEKSDLPGSIAGSILSCSQVKKTTDDKIADKNEQPRKVGSDECRYDNTNFLGGDLSKDDEGEGIIANDANDCSRICRENLKCNYWTFVKKWKVNCYLKSRLGQKSEFDGGEAGTYGKNCDSSSSLSDKPEEIDNSPVADEGGCRFPGINFLSGDLDKKDGGHGIETVNVDECKEQCKIRRNCQFWTFVKLWKVNCYLKKSKGPDQPLDGATSGTLLVPCDEAIVEEDLTALEDIRDNDHECRYENTNFIGADLPGSHGGLGITTTSAEECRTQCFNRRYCKHWSRIEGWKIDCYLKTSQAHSESKTGATSGSVGLPCNKTATLIQNDLGIHIVTPISTIETTKRPPTPPPKRSDDSKICSYSGLNYQGADLSDADGGNGLETSSADDCAEQCKNRPICSHWTYVKDWKVGCYLKHGFKQQNQKDGATSGTVGLPCNDRKASPFIREPDDAFVPKTSVSTTKKGKVPRNPTTDINGVCFFHGVALSGGDLPESKGGHGIESNDASDCAVQCYRTENCKYWVHVKEWKINCYLKTTFDNEDPREGVTSGSIGYSCS